MAQFTNLTVFGRRTVGPLTPFPKEQATIATDRNYPVIPQEITLSYAYSVGEVAGTFFEGLR